MANNKTIEQRIARLEKAVFGDRTTQVAHKTPTADRKGPTNGIRVLLSRGFLKKKSDLGVIRDALAKANYHYSAQAIDMALKRLSTVKGPLVALKEKGRKMYVERN